MCLLDQLALFKFSVSSNCFYRIYISLFFPLENLVRWGLVELNKFPDSIAYLRAKINTHHLPPLQARLSLTLPNTYAGLGGHDSHHHVLLTVVAAPSIYFQNWSRG